MDLINKIIHALTQVHPFHTMVVHFPIALTAAALFFILLALWRHSDLFEQVAFANISLAAVSTLAAGITGMMDNINNYDGAAPNANVKIVLASILLVMTTVTALVRWRNPGLFQAGPARKIVYVAAYVVSFGLASVLGFLGGVILYGF
jgi:uncharacterized membrane protein